MGTDGPGGSSCPATGLLLLGIGSLSSVLPDWSLCPLFPTSLRGCPAGIHRSLPQVSGVEAEPHPGIEKQPWGQRLEHLQRAVAQLEIERSRLQRHNVQLRTTLEQVSNFSCPQLSPPGSSVHAPLLLMQPPEQGLVNYSPRAKFGLPPIFEDSFM